MQEYIDTIIQTSQARGLKDDSICALIIGGLDRPLDREYEWFVRQWEKGEDLTGCPLEDKSPESLKARLELVEKLQSASKKRNGAPPSISYCSIIHQEPTLLTPALQLSNAMKQMERAMHE